MAARPSKGRDDPRPQDDEFDLELEEHVFGHPKPNRGNTPSYQLDQLDLLCDKLQEIMGPATMKVEWVPHPRDPSLTVAVVNAEPGELDAEGEPRVAESFNASHAVGLACLVQVGRMSHEAAYETSDRQLTRGWKDCRGRGVPPPHVTLPPRPWPFGDYFDG